MPPKPSEPNEEVDLDPERQRYVLDLFEQLSRLSYYDLLRVPRDADKKAIKRAYFDLVGLIHPDRYFGKRLGSYRRKMEAIFAQVTRAYETLLSADARARYDQRLGTPTQGPAKSLPVDPRLAARRQAAGDAMKQQFDQIRAKARGYIERAERARANQDFVEATEAYKAALVLMPNDTALKAAYAEVERLSTERLGETLSRQAEMQERLGRWAEAAECWRRVAAARPTDPETQRRLAKALARASAGG
jgi:curved DNA-binding protein CbpA